MHRRLIRHPSLPIGEKQERGTFSLDGRAIPYCDGDTVASAACAAGVGVFTRSFKYHRPRGLYDNHGYGAEVLVTIDGRPNVPADLAFPSQGVRVKTQNAWPSVNFDCMAVNNSLIPLLPNGFYYKMFHKPRWAWPWFEKALRNAAGLGRIDTTGRHEDVRHDKRYRFPDLCVVGGGAAGLATALAASREGRRVMLIERFPMLGGRSTFNFSRVRDCPEEGLNGLPEHEAVRRLIETVRGSPGIEILSGTTAFGVYEDNLVAAGNGRDLFKIRAKAVVVAGGANDRHLVFQNNDLPGIMTARGVERLVGIHGVVPGERAVVVTTHDGGYHTALILHGAGVKVVAVVDSRPKMRSSEFSPGAAPIPIIPDSTIRAASGWKRVRSVSIGALEGSGSQKLECDLVVMAVGFTPQLGLLGSGGGRPIWDSTREVFRVFELPEALYAAGEVNGPASFGRLVREGMEIGRAAARGEPAPESRRDPAECIPAPPADVSVKGAKRFVCKCMDVTRREIQDSIREGFDQIETLKRYTSMGMGPCQGKSCYEAAARIVGLDAPHSESPALPTTMRPPFAPVPFGVLAGRASHLQPVRRTPMHAEHVRAGARFLDAGLWKRPERYAEIADEVLAVRNALGIIDVSTLGKLELTGPDALQLLNFMLPGDYSNLSVGRVRYHTMVGEDGILFEDGTISHIDEGRYFLSTTTGNADAIRSRFWWWITSLDLDARLANLGPVLGAVNLSGPRTRDLLRGLVDIDLSNASFPYMSHRHARLLGIEVHLFRIGFTGELSYEIHFPAEYGESLWVALLEKGASHGIRPFGVEAQRVLRLEKGHLIPGVDTDALSSPYEAGVGFTIKDRKPDFIGRAFLSHARSRGPENRLVTYRLRPDSPIPRDGYIIVDNGRFIGRVTSSRMSPTLGHGIGLAWIREPLPKPGTGVRIRLESGREVAAELLEEHAFYDPRGEKLRS